MSTFATGKRRHNRRPRLGVPGVGAVSSVGTTEESRSRPGQEERRHRGTVIYGRASGARARLRRRASWRLSGCYAAALVEARTESPGDDFVSALTQGSTPPTATGTRSSREETISIMLQMLFARARDDDEAHGKQFSPLARGSACLGSDLSAIPA